MNARRWRETRRSEYSLCPALARLYASILRLNLSKTSMGEGDSLCLFYALRGGVTVFIEEDGVRVTLVPTFDGVMANQ